jgi:peptidoglycan/LPS O-acetylase OafA/YrhL
MAFAIQCNKHWVVTDSSKDISAPQRSDALQVVRACAALGVVTAHANELLAEAGRYGQFPSLLPTCGSTGVHAFFVLSGMVMVMTTADRPVAGAGAMADFWWRRARRILPPLWGALALAWLGHWLSGHPLPDAQALSAAILALPSASEPLLPVEWTLRHEMAFYAVFGLCMASRRYGGIVLGAWFAASAVGALGLAPGDRFLTSPWHVLFLIGMGAGGLAVRNAPIPRPAALLAGGLLLYVAGCAFYVQDLPVPYAVWLLVFGPATALILLGGLGLERRRPLRVPSELLLAGDASYSIYLVHFMALSVAAKVLQQLGVTGWLPPLAALAVLVATGLVAGLVFHRAVEKPLLALIPSQRPTWRAARLPLRSRSAPR